MNRTVENPRKEREQAIREAANRRWSEKGCLTVHAFARIDQEPEKLALAALRWLSDRCCGYDADVLEVDSQRYWVGVSYGH